MSTLIYFSVGRCQRGKGGCQAAAAFDQRSQIVSPDFSTAEIRKLAIHGNHNRRAHNGPSRRNERGLR